MNFVGIKSITSYVPSGRIDCVELKKKFNVDQKFLEQKLGSSSLARAARNEKTSDLACYAFEELLRSSPDILNKLGMIVVVTQTPDGYGIPHVSAIVHGKFGFSEEIAAFDISLGCSGWVYALSVCRSFMEEEGISDGILITVDPYSKIINPDDRDTAMLFGDAATITHLSACDPIWRIGKGVFGTDGSKGAILERQQNGFLHMNGRAVYEFAATKVPKSINQVLVKNHLNEANIDMFILHQGSKFIVDTIGDLIGASARTPYLASGIGNTVSSSIPLALGSINHSNINFVLVAGFGVGLSWAANILEKIND